MYKAPPPEVSSEDFYETVERRSFARGLSIQTSRASSTPPAAQNTLTIGRYAHLVCPTQGSANPALTITALAFRAAEQVISG